MKAVVSPALDVTASSGAATTSGRGCLSHVGRLSAVPRHLPSLPQRKRRAQVNREISCFGSAGGWGVDTASHLTSLSHLASLTGFLIGALWVGRELVLEEERENNAREVCDVCQGTGRVPCMCQRWSDKDVGCSACEHTGYTVCTNCRGGGTKVPVARVIPIYAKDENPYRRQQ
uniref:Uncharacterized protein n=1 Tax=Tetraselmis sp. GSL018 TaxID=582737 RepID=A0A061RNH7_9CHLO